jgi:hypothetical protein
MLSRIVASAVIAGFTLGFVACQAPQQSETPAASAPAESHEGHTGARVYFVEPKDGATLPSTSLAKFVFGSDNYTIAAVPPGELKPEQVRPNMGHFHLGVDKPCVPAGEVIVRGTPDWVHFGDGKNEIEMQLKPGKHMMSVQVGDDLHRAVEGLCETITVTVEGSDDDPLR